MMARLNCHSASPAARVLAPYASRHAARRSAGRLSRRGSSPTITALPLRAIASQSRSAKCLALVIAISPLSPATVGCQWSACHYLSPLLLADFCYSVIHLLTYPAENKSVRVSQSSRKGIHCSKRYHHDS